MRKSVRRGASIRVAAIRETVAEGGGPRLRYLFAGLALLAALLATLLAVPPAAADVLVLTDGSQVKTDGPWKVKGRLIVFTSTSGNLASLRADEVDLAASEAATSEALRQAELARLREAEPPPKPDPGPPILVLTDADVGHVDPEEEEAEEAEEEPTTNASGLQLTIAEWEQEESPDGTGVDVTGALRNDGANVATSIEVQVQAIDSQGRIAGTTTAELTSSSLGAGDILNFRATFPELVGFDTARFDISGREFRPAPPVTPVEELSEEEALQDLEPEAPAEPF